MVRQVLSLIFLRPLKGRGRLGLPSSFASALLRMMIILMTRW
jgi:hypothetical protein